MVSQCCLERVGALVLLKVSVPASFSHAHCNLNQLNLVVCTTYKVSENKSTFLTGPVHAIAKEEEYIYISGSLNKTLQLIEMILERRAARQSRKQRNCYGKFRQRGFSLCLANCLTSVTLYQKDYSKLGYVSDYINQKEIHNTISKFRGSVDGDNLTKYSD